MRRPFLVLLGVLVLATACGGDRDASPAAPSALPQATNPQPTTAAPASQAREIVVGEVVKDRVVWGTAEEFNYVLTAPRDGALLARLTWDPDWNGTLLGLRLDVTVFSPQPPSWSPVVGRLPVAAGQRYRISVFVAGADWLPDDPFELVTAIE